MGTWMSSGGKIRNLNDLAKHFNCTAMTVSMALRDSEQLPVSLREKIKKFARENNFSPRSYHRRNAAAPAESGRHSSPPGPLLILHNERYQEPNPARDLTMPEAFQRLNCRGVKYSYVDVAEFNRNPGMIRNCAGVLYYTDQPIELPDDIPVMQLFGWTPLRSRQDRVTVNDVEIAEIAAKFFLKAGVKRLAIVWRDDMLDYCKEHPRITCLEEQLRRAGIPTTPLSFSRKESNFVSRLQHYLNEKGGQAGFFAFTGVCGLMLACALEGLQQWKCYAPAYVLVCDNNALLKDFMPQPATIDLNFSMLTKRAVDGLLWRLENPDAPNTILYQSPRLELPEPPSDKTEELS